MKRKQRLVVRYAAVGLLCLVACVFAAMRLLDDDAAVPDDGLVPGLHDSLAHGVPSSAPALRFTRMPIEFRHFPGTRTHRLPEDMGSGVAMEDFDGDGRLDLFFVNAGPLGGSAAACALFRNHGDFRFTRVEVPVPSLLGQGVAVADYDGDGDFDIFVTGHGRNVLLRNEGSLQFRDVTDEAGLSDDGFSTGACWGDADGDGDLDLYVCRYVHFEDKTTEGASRRGSHTLPVTLNPSAYPAQSNRLYLNPGKPGVPFVEAAKEWGVDNPTGKSLQAVFADLDGDTVLDLYVANDVSDNALFRGVPGKPFEDKTHASCTADWRGAMGLAVGDPDLDGDLDLFITHWLPEENTLYRKEEGRLFFSDAATQSLLGPPSRGMVGWACDFADFDNDGRPDLWVSNGSTFERPEARAFLQPMPVQIFWNDGHGRFFDLAPRAGPDLQPPVVGRGGAVGDLDGDGDLDLCVVVHGGEPLLLRNDTEPKRNSLAVVVRGSRPNVFGYGAVVQVATKGPSGESVQTQQLGTKVGYLSSGPHVAHFGLGAATEARVTVRFLSGKVVEVAGRAGERVIVKEVDPRTLGGFMDKARDAQGAAGVAVYREVLALDPLHPGALYNLARLVEAEEALRLCGQLLQVEPFAARGHLLRARILSDPMRPEPMDLDAALAEVDRGHDLNREETGGLLEKGRILLLKGEPAAAAEVLEKVRQNPRAAALAALCHFRLGDEAGARRLLSFHDKKHAMKLDEEGDTPARRMGARDLLAQLLELGPAPADGWAKAASEPVSSSAVRATTYAFDAAARWCLAPPERCDGPPAWASAVLRADLDGDGDEDLLIASGCDPAAPLPAWIFRRQGNDYAPERLSLPVPGSYVDAIGLDGSTVVLRASGSWHVLRR